MHNQFHLVLHSPPSPTGEIPVLGDPPGLQSLSDNWQRLVHYRPWLVHVA
jgi:hypothetical protein